MSILLAACSVQQFSVNTKAQLFQYAGSVLGEDTREKQFKKDSDIHILGFNVKQSDTQKMAQELKAESYAIETKSNLLVNIITCGMVECRIVKVISRDR